MTIADHSTKRVRRDGPLLYGRMVFCALLLWGVTLEAPAQSRKERELARNMEAGLAAYEDGHFALAERYFSQVWSKADDPDVQSTARDWLFESLFAQRKYKDVLAFFGAQTAGGLDEQSVTEAALWGARVRFAQSQYEQVVDLLAGMDSRTMEPGHAALWLRLMGQSYLRLNKFDDSLPMLSEFARRFHDHPDIPANTLDWAMAFIELNRVQEAVVLLNQLLHTSVDSSLAQVARFWLVILQMEAGQYDAARQEAVELIRRSAPVSDLATDAWYLIAEMEAGLNRSAEALLAIEQGQQRTRSPVKLNQGRLMRARLLLTSGEQEKGVALLRQIIIALPDHSLAAEAQLLLAHSLLDLQEFDQSLKSFQQYLDAFDDVEGRAAAYLGRGWSLIGLNRHAEAVQSFEQAYALHPSPEDRMKALFKVGDAFFSERKYMRAREEYLRLIRLFPSSDLTAKAHYQAAECLARMPQRDQAIREFRAIETNFPSTIFAEQAAMRIGLLFEEQADWERAITAFNRVMEGYPQSVSFGEALLRRALIRYRAGQFKEALEDFDRIVATYPDTSMTEQSLFMRGWCLYLLGESDRALRVSEDFLRRYPQSGWAPDVLFWQAEYHYNRGVYDEAERRFSRMADRYPAGPLADDALYWAGRAAAGQKEYLRAIEYYNRLAREFPQSEWMPDVRFAQGDALTELGEFGGAILAFEEIIRVYPDSPLLVEAWGRKGDCQFVLAEEQPDRFARAKTSYLNVLNNPRASFCLQLQARYKLGRCYEMTQAKEDAFEQYMAVVYQFLEAPQEHTTDCVFWFTRASFTAVTLKESQGDTAAALQILRRVVESGVPAAPDAQRRIASLTASAVQP